MMALALATFAFVALFFLLQAWTKFTNSSRKLPPGPLGLPLLGSLHLLRKHPHRALHQLALKYGPIMHLRLGQVPSIVVSSPKAAESFLKTHDLAFASRPIPIMATYLTYDQKNITGSPYGPYWRHVRKICTTHFLSRQKIDSLRHIRKEEVCLLVGHCKEASLRGAAVNLTTAVASLGMDSSFRMVFGKKFEAKQYDERGFVAVLKEALKILSAPNLGDFFPFLAPFDVQGLTKKIRPVMEEFDGMLENIIDEHVQLTDDARKTDFVDVMLEFMGSEQFEFPIGRDHVKALMLDMLIGSMDTSATAIDWTLSEIMRHPRVMKKIQKELEEKVGLDRMVEESDLLNLEYLEMVVKETLRLHPVAPLLVPHKATQDTVVDGFLIPKDSQIYVNAWGIGRDPSVWSDAERFYPERFIGMDVDVYGQNFELIPFGSGRRGCPGLHLAYTVIRLVVAHLLHCFDWKLPDDMLPTDLDMTEKMGIVTMRAKQLHAIPSYRLHVSI